MRAAPDCATSADCRARALEAAERKDYEAFHDLAWRAIQLGPKNDPALLFLLARAQSLSGRPHDALVMLRRLAATGVAREAVDSPEFERVRTLRDWAEVEALLTSGPAAPNAPAPADPRKEPAAPRDATLKPAAKEAAPSPASPELMFAAASFKPAALAYDGVSRRFIISDTDVSRLAVIDEFSRHVATLASGHSAGFGIVTAIAIDPRAGDLWVASVDGSSGADVPALHKLQLISGRVLKKFTAGSVNRRPARPFVDVAVAPDGAVFAIEREGTLWRLPAGGEQLEPTMHVTHSRFESVTVSGQGAVYVVRDDGVFRMLPAPAVDLKVPEGIDLSGLARIRWWRQSLVGLQRVADGSYRVIRIRLRPDGRSATSIDVLDPSVATPNPSAATLAGDVFYYLASTSGSELAIRRVAIK